MAAEAGRETRRGAESDEESDGCDGAQDNNSALVVRYCGTTRSPLPSSLMTTLLPPLASFSRMPVLAAEARAAPARRENVRIVEEEMGEAWGSG